MTPSIEIVLPLRNPTAVLRSSVDSLLAQSSREFSVLLSDNWSSSGKEFLDEAEARLQGAGIRIRRVQPPHEVGRVEHWNWSHHQSAGDWLKPLFTGDSLDPEYVRATQAAIIAHPEVDVINCSFAHLGQTNLETRFQEGFRSPSRVLADVFREGNCLGGPVNVCLRKLAFICAGGYSPAYPVSADFALILSLALRNGLFTCGPVLAYFNVHPDRFSSKFPHDRIDGPREHYSILLAASSQAAFSQIAFDARQRNRYFWKLAKMSFKSWLERKNIYHRG